MKLNNSVGKKLGVLISAVLTITFMVSAAWFYDFARSNLAQMLHQQAMVIYQQIVLTRHWNASYGGVYVRKRPGVETNPYLYKAGPGHGEPSSVVPEITDTRGNVYTLRNPAMMTRELSDLSARMADVRFHLTSLRTINPANAPDEFETQSLKEFEAGARETSRFIELDGKHFYRFMAPLYVEPACLGCHGFQDYKLGDVRGGISVTLPMDRELAFLAASRNRALFIAVVLMTLAIVTIVFGSRYLVTRPLRSLQRFATNIGSFQQIPARMVDRGDEVGMLARELTNTNAILLAQRDELHRRTSQLEHDSQTDALTGLYNRRYLFSAGLRLYKRWLQDKTRLAVLMIDVDHFKRINDEYGHQVGDQVLERVAQAIRQQCRPYDLVVRYGGEEFLVMLATSAVGAGANTAQRIRQNIADNLIKLDGRNLRVTVSVGVVEADDLGEFDSTVRKADDALYEAKHAGRNRVAVHSDVRSS